LNSAEQHLVQGMDLVRETMTADAEMIMRGYLALARLQQARGESNRALATLDAFARMAHQSDFAPALLAHAAAVRAQVELAQGNLVAALHWADAKSSVKPFR
jgi:ATP/maltotriose-dependent transcriptional regulator MalT